MKKTLLKRYAHMICKVGVNVQKGQDVMIVANVDQEELVNFVVADCYSLFEDGSYTDQHL